MDLPIGDEGFQERGGVGRSGSPPDRRSPAGVYISEQMVFIYILRKAVRTRLAGLVLRLLF